MRARKALVLVVGIVAVAMGLLWVGQGLGYVHWPAKGNFMLDQRPWAIRERCWRWSARSRSGGRGGAEPRVAFPPPRSC